MEENKNVELDTVKNQETETEEHQDEKDLKIKELEEKLKSKAIEARLAKKEEKKEETLDLSSDLKERLLKIELRESGLKDSEEVDLVMKESKELGIDPKKLVERGLADTLLQTHRKAKLDEQATPGTSKRGGAINQKDNPEYWMAKGELPPKESVELRRKVIEAKRQKERRQVKFNN